MREGILHGKAVGGGEGKSFLCGCPISGSRRVLWENRRLYRLGRLELSAASESLCGCHAKSL